MHAMFGFIYINIGTYIRFTNVQHVNYKLKF
jgi:hypothetical protein